MVLLSPILSTPCRSPTLGWLVRRHPPSIHSLRQCTSNGSTPSELSVPEKYPMKGELSDSPQCPVAEGISDLTGKISDLGKSIDDGKLVETLEELELPTNRWGALSAYLLWIALVCLQLFRAELCERGIPDAVIDVAVSGTTAALALSWDQLVAGPRRNKMAKIEANISAKLDLQQQQQFKRDQVEAEIRARLEVTERMQRERAIVENQISSKLDAEMQAFKDLQKQILQQAVPGRQSPVYLPGAAESSQQLNYGTSMKASESLEIGGTISIGESSLSGMSAQVTQASLQPAQDGGVSLNLTIFFKPSTENDRIRPAEKEHSVRLPES